VQYWGTPAIAQAVGLKDYRALMRLYWEQGLPMLLRKRGMDGRRVWWSTDGILNPWLMQMVQEQRRERKGLLAQREKRVRVRSGNGKAAPQGCSPPPLDVVVVPSPADAHDAKYPILPNDASCAS